MKSKSSDYLETVANFLQDWQSSVRISIVLAKGHATGVTQSLRLCDVSVRPT